MKHTLLSGVALVALTGAAYANCPAITVADMGGIAADFWQKPEHYIGKQFKGSQVEVVV